MIGDGASYAKEVALVRHMFDETAGVRMLIHKFDRPRLGHLATMHFVQAEK